jgi:N-ethylmaleimide reductase
MIRILSNTSGAYMKFEALFKPLQVGPYKLAHRVALAPLTRMRAERDSFSPRPLNAEK